MRAAALAAAVVAAFVGVMYLRFASDSVPKPPAGAAVGGSQCVVFRTVSDGNDGGSAQATCPPPTSLPTPAAVPLGGPVIKAAPTPLPSAPLPAILSDMKVVPVQLGPAMDIPKDMALIVETGCWGCEGGPSGLVRVYTRPDGSVAYDSLLDPAKLGLPMLRYTAPDGSVHEYPPFITGYTTTPNASEIVAGLCLSGSCAGEGLSSWSPDSRTVLFRSTDGGVKWTEITRLDVGAGVIGLRRDGEILLVTYDGRESTVFRFFPGLTEVMKPPSTLSWPTEVLANGEIVWRDSNSVPVRSDGSPLVPALAGTDPGSVSQLLFDPVSMHGLATVYSFSPGGPGNYYLVPFDNTGLIGRGTFARAGEDVVWSIDNVWLGLGLTQEGFVLANASVPTPQMASNGQPLVSDFVPVALDLKQGTMRPLRPFPEGTVPRSRNLIAAIQRGPFARVVNTDNTCVNIRAEPLPSAGILDCAAEGVLLTDLGLAKDFAGSTWLHVATPAGAEGWANAQYLER